jgi:WD40-like Beta Propeller Repeat
VYGVAASWAVRAGAYTAAVRLLLLIGFVLVAQQPATTPPGTDIHEFELNGNVDALKAAKPQPIATDRGYDNQPFYTPDGLRVLFTANRDGKQTDIFAFDRKTRRVQPFASTAEGEYSPTVTADGKGVSVIRVEADGTQRLWRFDLNGVNPRLVLTDIKPVGYHAWIDDDQLALFVLGKPPTLQYARVSSGKARLIAENIGRSLHRIPNTNHVSFVHRESADDVWVKQFDAASGDVTRLVRVVSGNDERDVAWTPDGTLLMSAGTKIHAWRRGDKDWREVLDVSAHSLGAVTRMAVAPDGKAMAVVVNEPRR